MSEKKSLMTLLSERFDVQEQLEQLETEDLVEAVEKMDVAVKVKAAGIALYMEKCDRAIDQLDETIKRLQERKKIFQNRKNSLKDYVFNAMKFHGISKIEAPEVTISISKNPPSAEVYDERLIPIEYWKQPAPVLDKKALLEDLKEGVVVQGAALKQTESVRIR